MCKYKVYFDKKIKKDFGKIEEIEIINFELKGE